MVSILYFIHLAWSVFYTIMVAMRIFLPGMRLLFPYSSLYCLIFFLEVDVQASESGYQFLLYNFLVFHKDNKLLSSRMYF